MIYLQNLSKVAIITDKEKYTYRELLWRINAYANVYKSKAYKIIAVYGENSVEWISAFYSGFLNDCIVVPLDYMASIEEIVNILNDCRPDLIFIHPQLSDQINIILQQINFVPEIQLMDVQVERENSPIEWDIPRDIEKTALIVYTSGTAGKPKGVMLSYKNLIAGITVGSDKENNLYERDMQILLLLPVHHIYPLKSTVMDPLYIGATIVICPSMQLHDMMATLKENKIGMFIGVPRLYEMLYTGLKQKIDASFVSRLIYRLLKLMKNKKLSKILFRKVHKNLGGHIRIMGCGGAALPYAIDSFFDTLGFDVVGGYGMTEAAPSISMNFPGKKRLGSQGQPVPGISVEIRDGEIVVKGDNVMQGYYNQPEETAEVLKDGWLYTGDLGYLDKDNFLYITGRKKEIIVLSTGKKINPIELETKLESEFDVIKQAGVSLYQDRDLYALIHADEEKLKLLGIPNKERYFREKVLPVFNENLSPYKQIYRFGFVSTELPRTRLGKLQRFKLQELIEKAEEKKHRETFNESKEYTALRKFLETQVNEKIYPHAHLSYDLGLDSLSRLNLIDYLERNFGIKMDGEDLANFTSVKSLSEYIEKKRTLFMEEDVNWEDALKEQTNVKLPKRWIMQSFTLGLLRYFFQFYFKLQVKGLNNIPEGMCILTPNHQSFLDAFLIAPLLKHKAKDTFFYAKEKYVNNFLLRFIASHNHIIVMDIDKELKESIQKLAIVLQKGNKIVLFPEGTRTPDGNLGEFKKTFAILSIQLQAPVVPVVIKGAYEALPRDRKIPKFRSSICVEFLPAIYSESNDRGSLVDLVRQTISQNSHSHR